MATYSKTVGGTLPLSAREAHSRYRADLEIEVCSNQVSWGLSLNRPTQQGYPLARPPDPPYSLPTSPPFIALAQTWISSFNAKVTRVRMRLSRTPPYAGTLTGNMWVSIWSANPTDPTSTLLGTSKQTVCGFVDGTGINKLRYFDFTTPIRINRGQQYYVVFENDKAVSATQYLNWTASGIKAISAPFFDYYPKGQAWVKDSTSTWFAITPEMDFHLALYGWTIPEGTGGFFPEYFPMYFPRYFIKGGTEAVTTSGVRKRRIIWLTDADFPEEEAKPELVEAVKKYLRRGVVKATAAPPSNIPERLKGALTEVVRGVYVNAGVVETFAPEIGYLLLESIKKVAAGKPLEGVADRTAAILQAVIEKDEEEFLLTLLLTEIEIY